MFLYHYPSTVQFTETPTWAQDQQHDGRVAFSSDLFTGGGNGRSVTNNGKNVLMDSVNAVGSLGGAGHQIGMLPVAQSFLSHGNFPQLELPVDHKPNVIGQYTATTMADFNVKEKCRTCGEEMVPGDILQHMRNHMGPRRCEICNYEAPTKHHLREHLNTHTGLKPYKCQFCDKSFAAKNSLRVHTMYLHTKVRAHQCHFCDQRFVTTSERKSHELVHTDKCPVCQMSFRLRGHLRQHMKSHANAAFHHKKRE